MKSLELEIQAENSLKAYAKVLLAAILPQLAPFIGKKVFTSTGDKTKAFQSAFLLHIDMQKIQPAPIEGIQVHSHATYLDFSYGKLILKIGVCLNVKSGFTKYASSTIDLGGMKDGQTLENLETLERIVGYHGLDNIINLEEELVKIKEYKALIGKADEIKRTIKVDASSYKYID